MVSDCIYCFLTTTAIICKSSKYRQACEYSLLLFITIVCGMAYYKSPTDSVNILAANIISPFYMLMGS